MAKKPDWDYALRIRGVTLKTLPVAVLADYLKEFAALLGDDSKPVLDGIVKGSVVVRVKQVGQHPAYTRARIQHAANDPLGPGGRSFVKLSELMNRSGARGEIVDRQENTVVSFPVFAAKEYAAPEMTVSDVGTLDGRVVGISGADDTVHLRLLDKGSVEHRIVLRDIAMAQDLAKRFRSDIVRVHVHGTWRRTDSGKWEPHAVYADRVEILDGASPRDFVQTLRAIKTGWSEMQEPLKELADIRGTDDLHA
ncbi:MAG: hypothetical protein ABS55_04650 [Lautropia sp. SCN 70-15]|nr:MAG: hypothetical protein ABS55_04650 [Lautropia sp. SCN 70-15]